MNWIFNDDSPIYLQIMEIIKREIAIGNLEEGNKMPPVREMALEAGVNPNTMQKAMAELEREGLLCSKRTSGRFVAGSKEEGANLKANLSEKYMLEFTNNMKNIGYSPESILETYKEYIENL